MKTKQNKINKGLLNLTFISLILSCLFSCSVKDDPSIKELEAFNFYNSGNDQSGIAGQYLKDSLVVGYNRYIANSDSNFQYIHVHFEVITGGGTIDQPEQKIPANGFVTTKWKTGTVSTDQLVTASLYDNSGILLTKITFTAKAFQPGRWDMLSGFPNGYLNDMVRDTLNHRTFMIFGNTLYTEGENYFQWIKVTNFGNQNCHSIEIDSNGVLYVATSEGKLFKSTDLANTFTECSKPIPEYAGYFDLILSSDNTIWVSRFNYPLRFSNDGGKTWYLSESGLNNNSQSIDVFRFSTGKLITLSFDIVSLLESTDGIRWLPVNNKPYAASRIYVTDKDELILLNVGEKLTINKSVDEGKSFTQVYSLSAAYITSPMRFIFSNYKGTDYICIPGTGILKTDDYKTFKLIYSNTDIRSLMVDHNGVFFATNKDFNKVYCYK